MKNLLILVIAITFLSSCAKKAYRAENIDLITLNHSEIAILPFEMILTKQERESMNNIENVERSVSESLGFQLNYYDFLYRRKTNDKVEVKIQDYKKTLRLLEESGISIQQSWDMDPMELAALLKVDAVVRSRINKHRYFSDKVSFVADVSREIVAEQLGRRSLRSLNKLRNSKSIHALYELIDAENGEIIWHIAYECKADWSLTMSELIRSVNRKSIKQFPYQAQ